MIDDSQGNQLDDDAPESVSLLAPRERAPPISEAESRDMFADSEAITDANAMPPPPPPPALPAPVTEHQKLPRMEISSDESLPSPIRKESTTAVASAAKPLEQPPEPSTSTAKSSKPPPPRALDPTAIGGPLIPQKEPEIGKGKGGKGKKKGGPASKTGRKTDKDTTSVSVSYYLVYNT